MDDFVMAPIFTPSMDEFKDFKGYLESIQDQCKAGICKIIPPPEWSQDFHYEDLNIEELVIPTPIKQLVSGNKGFYQLMLMERPKLSVEKFQQAAEKAKMPKSSKYQENDSVDRIFWKNVKFHAPTYGADMSGSLFARFSKEVKYWNLNHLDSILNVLAMHNSLPGITTPYLYFGMWKAMFAWHVEDMNLFSINYLHFGEPKSWYCVAPEHGPKLERLAQQFFPELHKQCPEFLRHKTTLISPTVLQQNNIPFTKVVQERGQIVITFPYAYHCGFNHGYNCAESVNFALESWIDYAKKAKACKCQSDTVSINMNIFTQLYEEWKKNPVDLTQSIPTIPVPHPHVPLTKRRMIHTTEGSSPSPKKTKREKEQGDSRRNSVSSPTQHEPSSSDDHENEEVDVVGIDDEEPSSLEIEAGSSKKRRSPRKFSDDEHDMMCNLLKEYHGIPSRQVREELAAKLNWNASAVYNWFRRRALKEGETSNLKQKDTTKEIKEEQQQDQGEECVKLETVAQRPKSRGRSAINKSPSDPSQSSTDHHTTAHLHQQEDYHFLRNKKVYADCTTTTAAVH